jgi:hypothetical protein
MWGTRALWMGIQNAAAAMKNSMAVAQKIKNRITT